ncbi:hypothetical protein SVIO_010240 [Streptomyces violaceusniger]|uniref:Orn/Lys/Arg decarboxylases family 1 pyridoxal-P attachment site domain-containing protein n=1 Tax=Streptomyces violaceusniger TaxID=68280 RepID=A0A4D4KMA6_STRVO|nr:hypothetical protein SVIO_010240 [Streptomyces violaceusniger]
MLRSVEQRMGAVFFAGGGALVRHGPHGGSDSGGPGSLPRAGALPFTPPGHKQGRGADPEVVKVLGEEVFRTDLLAFGGLDDRLGSGRVLERAEELMADAVHAEHTFFSTCGSSLSVKAAMLAVAGPTRPCWWAGTRTNRWSPA